jgi:predicted esterase
MQKIDFKTQKTARIFTLGDLKNARTVWVVLHGYAQLAKSFLEEFNHLADGSTAILAPEGLHRFYRKGFYGDVVASWMTKEDRLADIEDYLRYLNQMVRDLIPESCTVHLLGFSQGVATACRWVADGTIKPDSLTLWAGTFPNDIDLVAGTSNLRNTKTFLAYDNNDVFRTEESWQNQLDFFKANQLSPTLFEYEGGHKIPKTEFNRFLNDVFNPSLSG